MLRQGFQLIWAARLLGRERLPRLVVADQPEARYAVVLVVRDKQVICTRFHYVALVALRFPRGRRLRQGSLRALPGSGSGLFGVRVEP